jgi:hypothetical protein
MTQQVNSQTPKSSAQITKLFIEKSQKEVIKMRHKSPSALALDTSGGRHQSNRSFVGIGQQPQVNIETKDQ